jgi:hypothetical protein
MTAAPVDVLDACAVVHVADFECFSEPRSKRAPDFETPVVGSCWHCRREAVLSHCSRCGGYFCVPVRPPRVAGGAT